MIKGRTFSGLQVIAVAWAIGVIGGCAAAPGGGVAAVARPALAMTLTADNAAGLEPLALDQVTSWAYQIQDLLEPGQVEALVESDYDLVVIEPTRDRLVVGRSS